jgi:diguanylate cyclase (GGDEF)-like protein/PAS domain S-box-containing protein
MKSELDLLAERMRALTRATSSYVLMLEDADLVQRAASGSGRAELVQPADRGLCGEAMRTGAPVVCDDIEADDRADLEHGRTERTRSTVLMPVIAEGMAVALLVVSSIEPRAFNERDVATLELLAGVLSAALGQAAALAERRFAEIALREHSNRLACVIETQRDIDAAGLDRDKVMGLIVERAMDLTRAEGAMVSMLEGDELVVVAARGIATTVMLRRPLGDSVARFAFAERNTLLIEDTASDQRINHGLQASVGDTSHICVPLFSGDDPVAVLNVMSASDTERLGEDDRRTLELLAVGLSAAVSRLGEFGAKARFQAVFENALAGMMVMSMDGVVLSANAALLQLIGRKEHEIVGVRADEFVHPEDRAAAIERARRVMTGELRSTLEHRYMRPDGVSVWVDVSLSVVPGDGFIIAVLQDLTRRKAAEAALRAQAELNQHQALHDALTGLPNRTLFHDRIEQSLHRARRSKGAVAAMMLDLDRFKEINDSLGHAAGDALLVEIARRLDGMLRASDTVARLGGDEFGILLPDPVAVGDVVIAARRVRAAIQQPVIVQGLPLSVDASIGIALFPGDGEDVETLLRHADSAMYHAKQENLGCSFYEPSRHEADPARLTLVGELRRALEERELTVHYQPKARLCDGAVRSVEALVRWNHPERGLVGPDQFIPIVRQTSLIDQLTLYVAEQAMRESAAWREAGLDLAVSLNLATRNVLDDGFPEQLARLLAAHPEARVEVELTESTLIADPARVRIALERIAALGVRIAIDDFGTGSSSLRQLRALPVQEVKIDRSLILNLAEDGPLIDSAIAIARNLGLDVVAEGVETAEALARLKGLGCTYAQGFHVCEPVPGGEVAARVASLL